MTGILSQRIVAVVALGAVMLVAPAIGNAVYAQTDRADALVAELKSLIERAERGRAADPLFLEDLRTAIGKYEIPATVDVFSDDFRDGDITSNPRWMVIEGEFDIDRNQGLRLGAGAPAAESPAIQARRARLAELIALREERGPYINVRSVTISGNPQVRLGGEIERLQNSLPPEPAVNATDARIAELKQIEAATGRWTQVTSTTLGGNQRVPVGEELARLQEAAAANKKARGEILIARDIPNAFTLEVNLGSAVKEGRLDIDIFQGARLRAGYRLTYNPGKRPGLVLSRFGSFGARRIGVFDAGVNLENGVLHNIVLSRGADMSMTLMLNGQRKIGIIDRGFRDAFDGVTVAHDGGEFTIRDIAVRSANR